MEVPVEEYTIGWISALKIEAVAATSMLDEKTEPPFQRIPGDKNSYICGKIGAHHVVITILPGTGGIAAGQAATNLTRTFPSIRYVFMVGIGGGIPRPKHDIKLGDIVVSVPTDASPGVRQIDIGKEEEGGFKLEGSLNQPDVTLLGAIKYLQVLHDMDEGRIHSLIKHPKNMKPKVRAQLAYQGPKDQKKSQPPGDCEECDQNELWPDPDIHYGIIASGSKVIKSASVRDRIGEAFNACCVEMEAYGLMNYFPCLVIRGISDFADGEKNDDWQGYASLTAAAYAKDLLLSMPVDKVHYSPVLLKNRDRESVIEWLTGFANMEGCPCTSPYDRESQGHQRSTGEWFLRGKAFNDWIKRAGAGLLCHGILGSGKTTISTAVITHLEKSFGYDKKGSPPVTSRISFVYCRSDNSEEQTPNHLLAVLLARLLPRYSDIPRGLEDLFKKKARKPRQCELMEFIIQMTSAYDIFLVIDGIDQCDWSVQEELLQIFKRLQVASVRVMITTRVDTFILEQPFNQIRIQPDPTELDQYLKAQVGTLKQRRGKSLNESYHEIEDRIRDKMNELGGGSFLLAKLQINHYCRCLELGESESCFEKEMTTPSDFYQAATDRIDGLDDDSKDFARKALAWVTHARRPLSKEELCHAIRFMRGGEYTGNPRETAELLINMCAGLIVLDTSNCLCFFHGTVKWYFDSSPDGQKWLKTSDSDIGSTCIEYLSNLGDSGAFHNEEAALNRLQQSPLLKYAAQHWGDHTRSVLKTKVDLRRKALLFLNDSKALDLLHQIKNFHGKNSLQQTRNVLPIHIAASFDLGSLLCDILDRGADIEAPDSRGQTALHVAVGNGFHASAGLLLAKGANINSREFIDGWTPLHLAAWKGHESVIDLLLQSGSSSIVKNDRHGQTALHLAALYGNVSILERLLSNGFDAKTRDSKMWNVLHIVAWIGNEEMMKFLLDKSKLEVGVNTKGKRGLTPLHCAAGQGHMKLTSLLLKERANENAVTSDGWTPLHWASVKRHDLEAPNRLKIRVGLSELRSKVAEFQKEFTDTFKSIDWILKTAQPEMSSRTYAGFYETLKGSNKPLLTFKKLFLRCFSTVKEWFSKLEDGSPTHVSMILEIQDELSSMRCGMNCAHEEIVRCLLEGKADPNAKCQVDIQIESRNLSGYDFTCLHIAVLSGHEGVVRALLDTSIDLDQACTLRVDKDTEAKCTVLHLAVICGHTEIIDLLLRKNADVRRNCRVHYSKQKAYEIPPIILAVFFQNQGVIPHLLRSGVDVNEIHTFNIDDLEIKLSALHISILMGDTEIVRFLVQCCGATTIEKACQFKYGDEFNMKMSVACMAALFHDEDLMLDLAKQDMESGMICTFQTQGFQLELPFLYLTALTMSDIVVRHVLDISPDITRMCTFRYGDFIHIDLPILPLLDPSVIPQGTRMARQIAVCASAQLRIHFGEIDVRLSTFFMAALLQNRPMMLFLLRKIDVDVNEVCAIELSRDLSLQVSLLHLVIWSGHTDVATCILEHGADVNTELKIRVGDILEIKLAALHLATLKSDEAMVLLLLGNIADDAEQKCEVSFCIENGTTSTQIQVSLTPLHLAILQGNIPFIQLLLNSPRKNTRFEVNFTSKMGDTETKIQTKSTAVHLAALVENSDAVTLLLDYKIHATGDARMISMEGSTDNDTFVSYLMAALGDLNPSKAQKRTRVDFKASLSGLSLAILLDNSLQTIQLLAQSDKDTGYISRLDISQASEEGNISSHLTPWHFAALTGHTTSIDCLLGANVELNTRVQFSGPKEDIGPTALQFAARFGHEVIIRCLIEEGAIFQNKSAHDKSPLELAKKYGHESIVDLLLKMPVPIDKELAQRTSAQIRLNGNTRLHDGVPPKVYERPAKGHDSKEQGSWSSKGLIVFLFYLGHVPVTWHTFFNLSNSTNESTPNTKQDHEDENSLEPTIDELPDGQPSSHETRVSHTKEHSRDERHTHSRSRENHRTHHSRRRGESQDSQSSHRSRRSVDANEKRRRRSRSDDSRHSSRHSRRQVRDTETTDPRGIWHHIKSTELFSQVQALVRTPGPRHGGRESTESQKRSNSHRQGSASSRPRERIATQNSPYNPFLKL
ncbi:unnamed protein product [Penicillium salamii]|nr:unnamed protein product [Penicillium salamii]